MGLAYVSCIRQLEEVKKAEYVDYIRPPIDKYGTLQFDAFDEIRDIGFYHGRIYFAGLRKAGQLWFTNAGERRRHSSSLESLHRLSEVGNYTAGSYARFTDLAEMVCRGRGATPDRLADTDNDGWGEMDSDPDSEDIISDPDEYMEEDESGFLSQPSTRGEVMAMSPFDREDMLVGMGLPGMAPLGLATGSFKKEFTKLVKDLQEDYTKKGFDEKLKEETLAAMHAKKPMKAAKKGTLKEKKDAMASLLNTVVERTEGMNDAWEHFASADPAFANVASYRNTEKTCPKGGMMAQRNEAVAYETRNMDGGMDMFEKQFDGVIKAVEKACED